MSRKTFIEWCHSTWSPWIGCSKVSPGCKNCYITGTAALRTRHIKHGDPRQRTSSAYWKQPLKWNREVRPTHWGLEPCSLIHSGPACQRPRIFPSLCDWLDDEVPIEWLADFLKLIHDTPSLDWLLLTKRPENWRNQIEAALTLWEDAPDDPKSVNDMGEFLSGWLDGAFPQNIWLGVSVEDQQRADERIPELLKIPAKVRFLSVEPMLERIDLSRWLHLERRSEQRGSLDAPWVDLGWHKSPEPKLYTRKTIDWIIVGGESGPHSRPCNVAWIRDIVTQCKSAGVPCFVKQLGSFVIQDDANRPSDQLWPAWTRFKKNSACVCGQTLIHFRHAKGGDPSEWPEDLRVREFPSLQIA